MSNTLPPYTVYVFGAGASYDCKMDGSLPGPPVTDSLIGKWEERFAHHGHDFFGRFLALAQLTTAFLLSRIGGIDPIPISYPENGRDMESELNSRGLNIENVLSFIDQTLDLEDTHDDLYQMALQARENFIEFTTELLFNYHLALSRDCIDHCSNYAAIARLIRPNSRDTILSFNWDCLFEHTVSQLSQITGDVSRPFQWLPDSLMRLDSNPHMAGVPDNKNIIDASLSRDWPYPYFLKLHGSLSWHTCANEHCIQKGKVMLQNHWGLLDGDHVNNELCSSCGHSMQRLIVAPTIMKRISQYNAISKQWMLARKRLHGASRIVIIGYSFPPSDYAAEWLFRSSLNSIDDDYFRPATINIVNPQQESIRRRLDAIVPEGAIEELHNGADASFSAYCQSLSNTTDNPVE